MRLSQPNAVTKLATAMVAWEVAADSRPQPAKDLAVVEGSRPQPTCVDLPRLIRLRPDRVRTDQEPVVFSLLLLLFEVDRRGALAPRQPEDAPNRACLHDFLRCTGRLDTCVC